MGLHKIFIGVNPLSWTNDDLPSLGGDTPVNVALSEGKEIGYAGFELGNKFPRDPDALSALLGTYELSLVSGWYSGRLADKNRSVEQECADVRGHLELLSRNGASVMVYGEVYRSVQGAPLPLYQRPRFLNEHEWQTYADKLSRFARFTASQGIQLAYHHHMGAYVETPNDIDHLMSLTDAEVGLLFDTGHITFAGGDAFASLKKHIHRVCHVHCKDVRAPVLAIARNRDWSFLQSVLAGAFTVPGDGSIDFAPIVGFLKSNGYEGWLVIEAEQDPAVAPPYIFAKRGFDTLRTLIDAPIGAKMEAA